MLLLEVGRAEGVGFSGEEAMKFPTTARNYGLTFWRRCELDAPALQQRDYGAGLTCTQCPVPQGCGGNVKGVVGLLSTW